MSGVVTALIMILLVLVAIGILWVVVKNLISNSTDKISLGVFTVDLQIKNIQVNTKGDVIIKVKRNVGEGNISGIKFIISDGDNTDVVEKPTKMNELSEKKFTINKAEIPGLLFIKEISIAPILITSSGNEKIFNILDKKKLNTKQLLFTTTHAGNGGNEYTYWMIYDNASYTIKNGDFLEYDIFCEKDSISCTGGTEIEGISPSPWNGRGNSLVDQNGKINYVADISAYADGMWYHRIVDLINVNSKVIKEVSLVEENNLGGLHKYSYRNIKITNKGLTKITFYSIYDGTLQSNFLNYGTGNSNSKVDLINI